jgi:hypothetical protein
MGEQRILAPNEVLALKTNGIKTPDDLWERVSGDFDEKITALSSLTRVDRKKLEDFLAAKEGRAAEWSRGSWTEDLRLWIKRLIRKPFRLEGRILIILLLLTVLLLRALGVQENLPSPLGLQPRVLVAKRDLKAGAALRRDDFDCARLVSGGNYVPATEQLTGCYLMSDIAWGDALHSTQVKRQQVTTTKEISSGNEFEAGTLNLTWSLYQLNAKTDLKDVEGHTAQQPLPSGQVVLSDYFK